MVGLSGFQVTANAPFTPPVPPFPANAADNGLSVDLVSERIVLGNDIAQPGSPAQLLSAREIELNGNFLQLIDTPNGIFLQLSFLGYSVFNGAGNLSADVTPGQISIFDNVGGGANVTLLNAGDQVAMRKTSSGFNQCYFEDNGVPLSRLFVMDFTNTLVQLGDTQGSFNGTVATIDDGLGILDLTNTGGTAAFSANGNAGISGTFATLTSITITGGIVTAYTP